MTQEIVISARDLGKSYRRLRARPHNSLRDLLQQKLSGLLHRNNSEGQKPETFWALQDASFDIARGENVGVIGLNGAGKSTLLKILSRIVTPTVGTARIVGRLGALLEVGTGFHRELTGRENTYLYGAILGMTRQEVARKFDAIVDFSEIRDFIDTPVKQYSSGMYVRLAFSVAAHLDPDILLLDEVLAVGDYTFQRKCMDFVRELQRKDSTILFVSHNLFNIKTMCQRVVYLKHGRIAYDGPSDGGIRLYETDSSLAKAPWFQEPAKTSIVITDVALYGEQMQQKTIFDFGDRMRVRIDYSALQPIEEPHFLCAFKRSDEVLCCNFSSYFDNVHLRSVSGDGVIELLTPPLWLVSDRYTLMIAVYEGGFRRLLAGQIGASFHVRHETFNSNVFGVFHQSAEWKVHNSGHAE